MCSFVCICTQLGSNFRVSASFEHFFVYYTVNHGGFIALPELVCVGLHTDTCLFAVDGYNLSVHGRLCVYLHVLLFHVSVYCVFVLM